MKRYKYKVIGEESVRICTAERSYKISGEHAVRIAERDGCTLYRHANPVDDWGEVTSEEALETIKQDPALIYVEVWPNGWICGDQVWPDSAGAGYSVDAYFRGNRYLGPDAEGVEPMWEDAV